jgi:molybdopterin/thiamine biosynthesis adenylyltransferase
MSEDGPIVDVIHALKHRGFEYQKKTPSGWFVLEGLLFTPSIPQGCLAKLSIDPTFVDIPRIDLLNPKQHFEKVVAHIDPNGALCYVSHGTSVFDSFDPVGQTLAYLNRACEVLEKIALNGMVEDLEDEFYAYWHEHFCFTDVENPVAGQTDLFIASRDGYKDGLWVITDSRDRTNKKLKTFGFSETDYTVLTYTINTDVAPRPMLDKWPPKTVADLLSWQGLIDRKNRKKIIAKIKIGYSMKRKGLLLIFNSPKLKYGIAIKYKDVHVRKSFSVDPIYALPVIPVSVRQIDDNYISTRNIPNMEPLTGKKILIVGCGTIGSFLAVLLARSGAGLVGGTLSIVDNDKLLPQNLGRHYLGFPDLEQNKAQAMANELQRLFPSIRVNMSPLDVRSVNLKGQDLIIDTTGEESLGYWLAQQCKNNNTPMLSTWIEGAGVAVRGLLKRNYQEGACYRCLCQETKKGNLKSVKEELLQVMAGQGCEGLYVPFPATVSVHAATLAAEMTLDFFNSKDTPTLRTRVLNPDYHLDTDDHQPSSVADCPICV